jgi:hypothetical protein
METKSPGETEFEDEFTDVPPSLSTLSTDPWPQPLESAVNIPNVYTILIAYELLDPATVDTITPCASRAAPGIGDEGT